MQTTGELDYGDLFLEGGLLYTPMAYILFIVFIVLMPILFNNLLVRQFSMSDLGCTHNNLLTHGSEYYS